MKPQDFYFQLIETNSNEFKFIISSKSIYDFDGILSGIKNEVDLILPKQFEEVEANNFKYYGEPNKGREILISLGFIEINFGLSTDDIYTPNIYDEYAQENLDLITENNKKEFKYYFEANNDDSSEPYFIICSKEFFDKNGYIKDDGILEEHLPKGFCELMESTFEYQGSFEEGKQKLISAGFEEKIITNIDTNEQFNQNSMKVENALLGLEEVNLTTLLENKKIDFFCLKNLSSEKLKKDLEFCVEREDYLRAAEIKKELYERNV